LQKAYVYWYRINSGLPTALTSILLVWDIWF